MSTDIDRALVGQVYSDNVPLGQSLDQPTPQVDPQRFWSTPARSYSDPTKEVLEARLGDTRLINHISLEVAHFPHRVIVQARVNKAWVTVAEDVIRGSQPSVISPRGSNTAHPQHHGVNHWVPIGSRIEPTRADRVRILLQRIEDGTPPVSSQWRTTGGEPWVSYSLGVRRLEIGYRIRSRSDIPPELRSLDNIEVIESASDRYGNRVLFSMYEEPARNLIQGGQWRSEPQPVNHAVVNLYADTRTETGAPQVIDRFYVDPLTIGPTVNLYVSNDDPTGDFVADEDLIAGSDVVVTGTPTVEPYTHISLTDSYITVSNRPIQWDPTKPWWAAFLINPQYPAAESHPVADLRGFRVQIDNFVVRLTTPSGASVEALINYAQNYPVSIMAGYDGSEFFVRTYASETSTEATAALNPGSTNLDTLRLGGYLTGPVGEAQMVLRSFVLKQDEAPEDAWAHWLQDPEAYSQRTVWLGDTTTNALLRMNPNRLTEAHPTGLVGGPGDRYAGLRWRPIRRDFLLTKGYLTVPPTEAKFWKFEFTNLVPQPYETFVAIDRTVRLFPRAVVDQMAPLEGGPFRHPGDETAIGLGGERRFQDQINLDLTDRSISRSPTEMLYSPDPAVSQMLSQRNWATGWAPWHVGQRAPQFVDEGQHHYEIASIRHRDKVGFFVGLKTLQAYRVDYTASDNTEVYRDTLVDLANWDTEGFNWDWESTRLTSGGGASVATSKVFESHHPVRAVQFAAQQSSAIQLAPDDDFEDTALATNDWDNPVLWHRVGDAYAAWVEPHAITITRDPDLFPAWTPGNDGFVDSLPRPTFSYRGAETPPISPGYAGLSSPLINTGTLGRIWAAARVTAERDLTSPLFVQILAEDGTLLAEESMNVHKGEIAEWYVGHTLGAIPPPPDTTTQPFEGSEIVQPLPHATAAVTTDPTPPPPPSPDPIDRQVRIRIIQKGTSTDSWRIDTLSLFDEGILWEFSNDGKQTWYPALGIRGNPNGVLTFPEGGTQLSWRARCARPGMHINSLQVRPWYTGLPSGHPDRPFRGPNISAYDQEPPIQEDPEWMGWDKPIPFTWFAANRKGRIGIEFTRLRAGEDDLDLIDDGAMRNVVLQRHGVDSATLTEAAHVVPPAPTLVEGLPRYMKRIENPE